MPKSGISGDLQIEISKLEDDGSKHFVISSTRSITP